MARKLQSPFAMTDVSQAYIAYCNGPWAKSPNWTKPTKPKFTKMYNERHDAAVKAEKAKARAAKAGNNTSKPATRARGNTQSVQEAAVNNGAANIADTVAALTAAGASADVIANVVTQMLAANPNADDTPTDEDLNGEATSDEAAYIERTPADQVPADAARNGVLWALNTEGLLQDAMDAAVEEGLDYISQEIGTSIMAATFGPLQPRR